MGSLGFASCALGLASSGGGRRLSPVAVALLRSGLLVLDTRVSLVVTCTLSVLLSSTALLVGRGLPEAVRLCEVETLDGCGDGLSCLLESDLSALKLSRALAEILVGRNGFSCAAAPFMPNGESLVEEEDIACPASSAFVAVLYCRSGIRRKVYQETIWKGIGALRRMSLSPAVYNLHRPRFWWRGTRLPHGPLSGTRCELTPVSHLWPTCVSARDRACAQGSRVEQVTGVLPEPTMAAASTVCLPRGRSYSFSLPPLHQPRHINTKQTQHFNTTSTTPI